MTQSENHSEKRKKALLKLQNNRGNNRNIINKSVSTAKIESINSLVKEFKANTNKIVAKTDFPRESETKSDELNLENLPKIAKESAKIQQQQTQTAQAVKRIQEAKQKIKQIRQLKLQGKRIDWQENQQLHHQLRQDLLTTDFWQQTSHWLSSMNTDVYLSSTPREEIELLYKQAKHRYKALQLMLKETQQELDAFELYFRNLDSISHNDKNQP